MRRQVSKFSLYEVGLMGKQNDYLLLDIYFIVTSRHYISSTTIVNLTQNPCQLWKQHELSELWEENEATVIIEDGKVIWINKSNNKVKILTPLVACAFCFELHKNGNFE